MIHANQQVLSLNIRKSPVVAPDRSMLSGLVGILDADALSELTDQDPETGSGQQ